MCSHFTKIIVMLFFYDLYSQECTILKTNIEISKVDEFK